MSKSKVEDTISICFKAVRKYKTGSQLVQCFQYLTSIRLKYKFAKKRLTILKRKKAYYMRSRVEEYTKDSLKTTWPDNYAVLMEFDHCVTSLRSSLEHFFQLTNVLISLGLAPLRKFGEPEVSISAVISAMDKNELCNTNVTLRQLRLNIGVLKNQPWYEHLHNLRIELYHNQFTHPDLVEHRSKDRELLDISWWIPNIERTINDTGITHVDIIDYCEKRIANVEGVLNTNLVLLNRFLE